MGRPPSRYPARIKPKNEQGRFFKRCITICICLSLLYLVFTAGLTWMLVGGNYKGLMSDPRRSGVGVGDVHFKTSDGKVIDAWYADHNSGKYVILAHGRREHRGQYTPLMSELFVRSGMGFLAFDFRASGKSEGFWSTGGIEESRDLAAAIDWLRKKPKVEMIALVASDMACVAAMSIPKKINKLDAVVFIGIGEHPMGAFERKMKNWHLPLHPTASLALVVANVITGADLASVDMHEGLGKIWKPPVLFIGGEEDLMAPPDLIQSAAKQLKSSDKVVEIFPGLNHARLVSSSSGVVLRKITAFMIDRMR